MSDDQYEAFESGIVEATNLDGIPDPSKESASRNRVRDTYSAEEVAVIDRAAKILTKHGDKMRLRCGAQLCPKPAIEFVTEATAERGAVLRCGCTDRVFLRHPGTSDTMARAAARRLRRASARLKHR